MIVKYHRIKKVHTAQKIFRNNKNNKYYRYNQYKSRLCYASSGFLRRVAE
jgi:hypothetical protein